MTNHTGLDTMYDNTHGDVTLSIMNALSGVINNALSMGAEEEDCEECRAEILTGIQFLNCKEIKKRLCEGSFLVRLEDGFMDVGYLLSLRF